MGGPAAQGRGWRRPPPHPGRPLDVRSRPGAGKGRRERRPPGLAGPGPLPARSALPAAPGGDCWLGTSRSSWAQRRRCGEAALTEPSVFHRFSNLAVSVLALDFRGFAPAMCSVPSAEGRDSPWH